MRPPRPCAVRRSPAPISRRPGSRRRRTGSSGPSSPSRTSWLASGTAPLISTLDDDRFSATVAEIEDCAEPEAGEVEAIVPLVGFQMTDHSPRPEWGVDRPCRRRRRPGRCGTRRAPRRRRLGADLPDQRSRFARRGRRARWSRRPRRPDLRARRHDSSPATSRAASDSARTDGCASPATAGGGSPPVPGKPRPGRLPANRGRSAWRSPTSPGPSSVHPRRIARSAPRPASIRGRPGPPRGRRRTQRPPARPPVPARRRGPRRRRAADARRRPRRGKRRP